jgi:hypothetical protein
METVILLVIAVVLVVALVAGLVIGSRRRGPVDVDTAPPAPRPAEAPPAEPRVRDEPAVVEAAPPAEVAPEAPPAPEPLRERFKRRLTRTRNVLGSSVVDLFGRGVTDEAWEGLEEALIAADVGVTATMEIVEELRRRAREEGATHPDAVVDLLKEELRAALGSGPVVAAQRPTANRRSGWSRASTGPARPRPSASSPPSRRARASVVLAAADTFRAAAAEQLGLWAERTVARGWCARTRAPTPLRRLRRLYGGQGHRRRPADRRHGGAAAQQARADGRARQGQAGRREAVGPARGDAARPRRDDRPERHRSRRGRSSRPSTSRARADQARRVVQGRHRRRRPARARPAGQARRAGRGRRRPRPVRSRRVRRGLFADLDV